MQEVFEKIIEGLDKSSDHYECEEQGREDVYMVDLEKAIEIVKEVAAEYNNGWIPCENSFPPQDKDDKEWSEYVLTLQSDFKTQEVLSMNLIMGMWINQHEDREYDNDEIIAWQPLPAPYKPKED